MKGYPSVVTYVYQVAKSPFWFTIKTYLVSVKNFVEYKALWKIRTKIKV